MALRPRVAAWRALNGRVSQSAAGGVVEAGGQPNQALGEGLLAVFGLKSDPVEACRAAAAPSAISAKVDVLNDAGG